MATLNYTPGYGYRLDGYAPHIIFNKVGARIGCHVVSTEAMDKLTDAWQAFRKPQEEVVLSVAALAHEDEQRILK